MDVVEILELSPRCPVGREGGVGYAVEDGLLGLEDKVVERMLYGKMMSENGGTGTGCGSECGANALNF